MNVIRGEVIKGTVKEIRDQLSRLADDEPVKLMIGRPSLAVIARRLQAEAAASGMTAAIHDELIGSLKPR